VVRFVTTPVSDAARAVAVYSRMQAGDRRLRSILAIVRRVAVEVGKVSGSSSQSSDWGCAEFAFIIRYKRQPELKKKLLDGVLRLPTFDFFGRRIVRPSA